MNTCTRCSASLAQGVQFCMNCGEAVSISPKKRAGFLLPLLTGAGLLFALFATLAATGVLRLPGKSPNTAPLLVPGAGSADTLAQEGSRSGGTLTVPGEAAPGTLPAADIRMPDDVRRWLEHLKRVDERREEQNSSMVSSLMRVMGSIKPGAFVDMDAADQDAERRKSSAGSAISDVDKIFDDLTRDFQSLPPPAECREIAQQYSAMLLEMRKMTTEVFVSMENLDIGALEKMKGSSFERVDTRAQHTNKLVDGLCKKYNEPNKYVLFVDRSSPLVGSGSLDKMSTDQAYQQLLEQMLKDIDKQ